MRLWLEGQAAESAFLTDPVSVQYLTGFFCQPHERLMALVMGLAASVLIVPALEVEAARAAAPGLEVRGWRDGDDLGSLVAGLLGRPRTLAVEKRHLTLAAADSLAIWVGADRLIDASHQISVMRRIKDEHEVACLEAAARFTDEVWGSVLAQLAAGLSEREIAGLVAAEVHARGCEESFPTLAQSGPHTALPHLSPQGRRLARGDLVLLDFGAAWRSYKADLTRMAVVGAPSRTVLELHATVLAAHDAAIVAIAPGVRAGDVDEAARAVLRDAGRGDEFIHRLGHGLGLEAHEAPGLEPDSELVLEPGMVVTVEPGAYLVGWGGVRIEDDLLVTETGSRRLTNSDPGLAVIVGG
ncbi:MAG TPA: Xaa-Pro peptidase family protein [Candidatus Acidoferrales bacterium]|nr:Xaa-Pro peptidase family protein [Candidatus Acidoferrales bacterium]